jgi:hypothetical protein
MTVRVDPGVTHLEGVTLHGGCDCMTHSVRDPHPSQPPCKLLGCGLR